MCFKNLPIEFDSQGKAQLKEGVSNPYTYQVKSLAAEEDQLRTLLARNGHIKSVFITACSYGPGVPKGSRGEALMVEGVLIW